MFKLTAPLNFMLPKKHNNKLVVSYLSCVYKHTLLEKTSRLYQICCVIRPPFWEFISSMRTFIACHIPVRWSRVQIGCGQISPWASATRDLGKRLAFTLFSQLGATLTIIGQQSHTKEQHNHCLNYLADSIKVALGIGNWQLRIGHLRILNSLQWFSWVTTKQ